MTEQTIKQALVLQAELITEGLIERESAGWRLTEKGEAEGRKIWDKFSPKEEALCLFYARLVLGMKGII